MKHVEKREILNSHSPIIDRIFRQNCIFFDIETTGFSSSNSMIYLIGTMRREGTTFIIDQFFAESKQDEPLLLNAFLESLENKDTLLSFNGVGFDLPFIKGRCAKYHIEENLKDFHSIDIYKLVTSLKFLLQLPNYKQKSIEAFLGITRDDTFSGGELIEVYEEYIYTKDKKLEHFLLLHNYEDVLGMLELLPVFVYSETLNGAYQIDSTDIYSYQSYDGENCKELIISLKNEFPVPKPVSYHQGDCYLSMNDSISKLRIPILEGELKYFYPNYKDYFYLPKEDMVIHKSVASFVDKEFKEKAKACNCYTRKNSCFIPQLQDYFEPVFLTDFKSKPCYFELTDEFLESKEDIILYVNQLFQSFIKAKRKDRL